MHDVKELLDIIPEGKGNAIHLDEVACRLNCHTMAAKDLIRKARLNGAHILSDSHGYWISSVVTEMRDYVERMIKHASAELIVIRPIIDALNNNGQISLTEYFDKYIKEAEQGGLCDE